MKKFISIFILSTFLFSNTSFSYSKADLDSANYLWYKWFIVFQDNELNYNLDKKISRREILKVMVMISWINVSDSCTWKFSDISKNDWACKYTEVALRENFIALNSKFNPDNNISKIEALKMIMQGIKIAKKDYSDWRIWYVKSALEKSIIDEEFSDYDTQATRWWIFNIAKKAYMSINDDELDLINFFIK
jgi:hypothetical protein